MHNLRSGVLAGVERVFADRSRCYWVPSRPCGAAFVASRSHITGVSRPSTSPYSPTSILFHPSPRRHNDNKEKHQHALHAEINAGPRFDSFAARILLNGTSTDTTTSGLRDEHAREVIFIQVSFFAWNLGGREEVKNGGWAFVGAHGGPPWAVDAFQRC
ncbi:hypothetical protein B0H16DRAFT_1763811 [Mycena metata]|uniref:Uncharacterized protein n=1 Tax=Mycena metata TaxID=1033252 RepID=A0AAD7MYQ1_9AGAR|nr:hypothetical protein B0H16DRAFT_1763811 [Mycena metata]